MENINDQIVSKTLAQWMNDHQVTDSDLADLLVVSRQTVWRWREKGIIPHPRYRRDIQSHADCNIVFGET